MKDRSKDWGRRHFTCHCRFDNGRANEMYV